MDAIEFYNMETHKARFLTSGIAGIDAITGGYAIGELTILCAGSSGGKSLVSMASACVASEWVNVLYISCENHDGDDQERFKNNVAQYSLDLKNMSFDYHNMNGDGIVMEDLEQLLADNYYELVFIDSIDLINTTIDNGMASYNAFGQVAKTLRRLAYKYDVAIVATAQVKSETYKKQYAEVKLNDIADSIKIPRTAHDVWYIRKEDKWAFKILKHRSLLKTNVEGFCISATGKDFDISHVWNNPEIGLEFNSREWYKRLKDEKRTSN